MIALTTLGIALLWIALSMLVALILGQILGGREAQLATQQRRLAPTGEVARVAVPAGRAAREVS